MPLGFIAGSTLQLDESNLKFSIGSRPKKFPGRDPEKGLGRDLDRVEVLNTRLCMYRGNPCLVPSFLNYF
jgi:hypothetical protein